MTTEDSPGAEATCQHHWVIDRGGSNHGVLASHNPTTAFSILNVALQYLT